MAHENGRIFIDRESTPNIGVSIADVQAVLGRGVNDLGLLCSDQEWFTDPLTGIDSLRPTNKINENSKNKPVRSGILGVLTDEQFKAVNWGLRIPDAASLLTLIGYVNNEESGSIPTLFDPESNGESDARFYKYMRYGWWYCRPRGRGNGPSGANEWFRLRDFENYNGNASPVFSVEPQRTSIDSGAFYVDLITNLDLSDPDYADLGILDENGLVFVVAVVKTSVSNPDASTIRFKSSPATLYGSTVYSVVEFTSTEVGSIEGGVNSSKVFVGGKGNYYVYGFLMKRTVASLTPPFQNLDSSASGYVALNALPNCVVLPCQRQVVEFVDTPIVDPVGGLSFEFDSIYGNISYNSTNGRFNVGLPELSAENISSSQISVRLSLLFVSVIVEKLGNMWQSQYYPLFNNSQTVVQVPVNETEIVFASASIVINDPTIVDFLNGENIDTCRVDAVVYYWDADNNTYWPLASVTRQNNNL